ncbi:PREDICTED: auxin-responsive protein SAUR36-like [Nicotiana attenuata]|uniref:Auxin-responsive protein saur36 n=1 Tax=Nicotiana attenuata TaxID=49451 RepID=A0A1J6IV87_NICAT|nr:PREDICTED: auxin-responsive protein SAUR36-like [Nicotiana attenuata]OIT04496.1 auxin-responsive protein saur36 [Nicotiana attenuata]
MGKIQGFVLKHRVTALLRCSFRRRKSPAKYQQDNPLPSPSAKPLSKFLNWTKSLKIKAKVICSKIHCSGSGSGSSRGYIQIGQEPVGEKSMAVPKGQMAVYVGQKDGDFRRVLVPVIYFNHPLFSGLLREVEDEYGFNHPGGITIPCRISEFERVQTRIKQGRVAPKVLT